MLVNKIQNISYINFKQVPVPTDSEGNNAILMLRDPNASVRFQQNRELAQNADAVSTNPFKALGYKLYRTFSLIRNDDAEQAENTSKDNTLAWI